MQDMHREVSTNIRTCGGTTKDFQSQFAFIKARPYSLYAAVLDEIVRSIQEDVPWCILLSDDIVLVDETKEGVNLKLERWKQELQ